MHLDEKIKRLARRGPLPGRVWLVFMLVGVLGLSACSGLGQDSVSRRDHEAAVQTEVAKRLASQIESFFLSQARDLELLTQVIGLQDRTTVEQRSIFSELLSFDLVFDEVALLDGDGQETIRESRREIDPVLRDRSDQPEFIEAVETRDTYFSPVYLDPLSSEPLITISVPLVDLRTGEIAYVLVGQVRFRVVWEMIQAEDFEPGQDLYLVDSTALVVAHSNPSVVLGNTRFEPPATTGQEITGLHGDKVVIGLYRFNLGQQEFTMIAEMKP